MQEGKQNEGLKLVSCQFRKRRLAPWAAPGPGCLGPVTGCFDRSCAGGKPAARQASKWEAGSEGKQNEGLKLEFLVSSESDVWHYGLLAPRPFRPSGLGCLGPATGSSQLQEQASKWEAGSRAGRQAE